MKVERFTNVSNDCASKNETSPRLKPMPFDAFVPSQKTEGPKKAKGGFLKGIINTCVEVNKRLSEAADICKAIDESQFFRDKKGAKDEILKNLSEYNPNSIRDKIKFFDRAPFIGNDNFYSYDAINYVIKNNELDYRSVCGLFDLTETQDRSYIAHESDKETSRIRDFCTAAHAIKNYADFDSLSAKEKYEFIEIYLDAFSSIDFNKIKNSYSLNNIPLIKDIIEADGVKNLQGNLRNKMLTGGVQTIPTSKEYTDLIIKKDGVLSLDKLSKTLNSINLEDYKNGIPLEYPREKFIADFKYEVSRLNEADKKEVYKYFKFNIDDKSKMTSYPIPSSDDVEGLSEPAQKAVQNCREIVNKFTLENKVTCKDKELENTINAILKAFPEFSVVIGKKTHRRESLDYHTLKVLQGAINDPDIKTLSEEEQRIVILGTLFHDFSKREEEIDKSHPYESARYANGIIKKLDIKSSEKERIYTLIQHSHWLEELSENKASTEDIATYFRNPNDFKIAQIIARADINSSEYTKNEFNYALNTSRIKEIRNNIDKIHTNGNLIYNTKFPVDKSLFPTDKNNIKVLDLTNPDEDLGKYGFEKGLTPKDLKSYIHCPPSSGTPEKMLSLCDDKQDVVLSTTLFNNTNQYFSYSIWNSSKYVLMLDCPNSNVILGGPTVSATGGQRGYDYVKNVIFEHGIEGQCSKALHQDRKIMPQILKDALNVTDEEYKEIYNKIANTESTEDLPNKIQLSNGREFTKEYIKNAINVLYDKLFDPANLGVGNGYQNEICIYKPKVQAFAVKKQAYESGACKEVLEAAKKYNIPVALV